MILFKNHKAFTLIETMFALAIAALVLTPLFILQGTMLQQVSRASNKIERIIFIATQFMWEAKLKMPPDAQTFTLEKKIDDPLTFLKYEVIPLPEKSSLAQINSLYRERVVISWEDGTTKRESELINFIYKPERKS